MSTISTAVALSDLHLGRDIGYLYSTDPNFRDPKFKKNSAALLTLLQRLGPQDELILNGDILELSLAGLDEVYRHVRKFFELVAETGPYMRIVYIPGNHDHHFWRTLGEKVYVDGRISHKKDPPGHYKYTCCFVDERFSSEDNKLPCKIILGDLWPKNKPAPEIVVKYPHHLTKITLNDKQKQYYLITHGHFLEDLFKPVNLLIDPAHLEELEAFNNIWLEALGYHLGHAGRLSERARNLVHGYEEGEKEARRKVKEILDEIQDNLRRKLKIRWPKTWLLKVTLAFLVKIIPLKRESGLFKVSINEELKKSIHEYIDKYVIKRYREGKAMEYCFPLEADVDIPTPFTFVFGHTHRPIKEEEKVSARVLINGQTYPLANTGGWLRTDGTRAADGENAGVLVIDKSGVRWETLQGKLE